MGRFKTTSSYITMVASKMGSLQPPSLYCRRLMKLQKEWNARSTDVKVPASFRNLQVVNAGGYIRVNVSTAMFAAFLSQHPSPSGHFWKFACITPTPVSKTSTPR